MPENNSEFLNDQEKIFLLKLARETLNLYLEKGRWPEVSPDNPKLTRKQGVFVTLKVNGELRGCIGYPLPVKPLYQAVMEMAVAAATEDYRFPPLSPEELDQLSIEISVLTRPKKVNRPEEVVVGRHGIIISKGYNQGLLLPQVPVEYGWDLETYLSHGCLKAGLPPDEWRRGVNIEVFEAQVFSEDDYNLRTAQA
ncbi:MAG TPA: AmmeMemoRadiSam system protein A [Candidatus Saccharicenans sp.]|jgi:AmmeMemoRadiSam system protein A|nr:AmmeMemoRadiSam system protein A [Candidatus Saccharicenans sp.]HQO75322.1 AmmeMemoRadiSam system protein A [Candidatus Saccharicenans sp.]HUM78661.1 AmmeMemoRadiSam system protein A [Candidatus Saccharicenans sp.]